MRTITSALAVAGAALLVFAGAASAGDTRISVGSPATPFSQNKQNEPALAVNQWQPSMLVQGANDNVDLEACNAGDDTTCPFTPGVGTSGLSFSLDSGSTWDQPSYSGYSAASSPSCLGVIGDDPGCTPFTPDDGGQIHTVPWYYESGLISDGDPALAFGPAPDSDGHFAWTNGRRLYYADLTSNFASKRTDFAFKGIEGIGVSRTDDAALASTGGEAGKNAWMAPVVIPSTSSAAFADKEQIWADNAASSSYFGNVYVCFGNYRGGPSAGSNAHDMLLARSSDGGDTWSRVQLASIPGSSSGKFGLLSGTSGCTIRTASDGTVYVFWVGWNEKTKQNGIYMAKSADGGATFTTPRRIFQVFATGVLDPVQGRNVMDGIAGARADLSYAPSIDIANNAPDGGPDATNQIVLTWVDGRDGLNNEHVMFSTSTNGGNDWTGPSEVETEGDRGYYSAAAISPNGQDAYLVYNAFTAPYQDNTTEPRPLVGVVKHADIDSNGNVGTFDELNRGDEGDARSASANALTDEFLGDYVYAVATNDYGAGVWNDARNGEDCPAIDAWRAYLQGGTFADQPAPQQDCPAGFGNIDIYGGSWPDPTP